MVAARSAAMGFNRLVDARSMRGIRAPPLRELPAGRMTHDGSARCSSWSRRWRFSPAPYQLGWVCFVLSPVALAIVFWYSLAKRVTRYTQAFLGLAMAVAPVGGWLAAGGRGAGPAAVDAGAGDRHAGSAGFDVLYACQDVEFDRREGLRSIPRAYGVPRALLISRGAARGHGPRAGGGRPARGARAGVRGGRGARGGAAGVGTVARASADDLSQVKRAFDMNGWVGVLYFAATAAAVYWR